MTSNASAPPAPASALLSRALAFDVMLAVLVWGSVSWLITADQAGERAPDALAYLWALGLGCLMLVRRRYPQLVLWITVAALFGYYFAGYPAVGLSVPAAGALLTAAEFCRLRWPLLASAVLLAVSYGVRLLQGQDLTRIIGYELVGHLGLMAAAIALGASLRLRRELAERSAQLLSVVRERERSGAQAALAMERTELARELHDSLGHRLAVLSLHTEVAAEAVETNEREADTAVLASALAVIRETADAMSGELHETVRALRPRGRSPSVGSTPAPLSLSALAPMIVALPLEVDAALDRALRTGEITLPAQVEAAAVRIVQEALTNVVRHSLAAEARVTVALETAGGSGLGTSRRRFREGHGGHDDAGHLCVLIADPGPPRPEAGPAPGGLGLQGMRERAEALGGSFEAGPRSPAALGFDRADAQGRGFAVEARLPLGPSGEAAAAGPGVHGQAAGEAERP
ncbi:sensor histidine kinase [Brevibacterium album]|uniref:sensor histidine kinase n=1 Tax=Brevibacterium album TaxID=417948 RepID=UPI0004239A16|nr:histidine kinase [Brevibacterium album]